MRAIMKEINIYEDKINDERVFPMKMDYWFVDHALHAKAVSHQMY